MSEEQGFWGKRGTAGQAADAAPRRFRPRFLHCRAVLLSGPAGAKRATEARSGGDAVRAGARSAPRRRRWFSVLRASAGASQARVRVPDGVRGARERRRAAGGAQRGAASRPIAHPERLGLEWRNLCRAAAPPSLRPAAQARSRCVTYPKAARRRVQRASGNGGCEWLGQAKCGDANGLLSPMCAPPTAPHSAPRRSYTPGPRPGGVPRSPPPVYWAYRPLGSE